MATYSGMNLRGEVRESVSLDEDDLSDVEDEVFIRDGKSGYKVFIIHDVLSTLYYIMFNTYCQIIFYKNEVKLQNVKRQSLLNSCNKLFLNTVRKSIVYYILFFILTKFELKRCKNI